MRESNTLMLDYTLLEKFEFGEVKIVKVALEENHADVYEVSSNVLTNFSFEDKGR